MEEERRRRGRRKADGTEGVGRGRRGGGNRSWKKDV